MICTSLPVAADALPDVLPPRVPVLLPLAAPVPLLPDMSTRSRVMRSSRLLAISTFVAVAFCTRTEPGSKRKPRGSRSTTTGLMAGVLPVLRMRRR